MKYIKQVATGHYHPTYITEEITRTEAIFHIGEERLKSILNDKVARQFGASVLEEVNTGLYVGIDFGR